MSTFPRAEGVKLLHPERDTEAVAHLPVVSVLMLSLNRADMIARAIDSVMAQDYPRIQFVIQDGASSDGTLEVISRYGDGVTLYCEADDGAQDAHLRGLRRCRGDVLTMCWTDEELAPHCLSWGVEQLLSDPELGGIYGDVVPTDENGRRRGPRQRPGSQPQWELLRYLAWDILPSYAGSFVWRDKLEAAGFWNDPACVMYDYYAKLGLHHPVRYIPGYVAKFSIHRDQISSTKEGVYEMLETITVSLDRLLADPATPEQVRRAERQIRAGIYLSMINTLLTNLGDVDEALLMLRRALELDPEERQLARVAWESYDFLLKKKHYVDAQRFFDAIYAARRRIPGLNWGRATALMLQHRFDKVAQVVYA
jgi:glycosyltransferase involved in cell wall biosynthesis